MKSQWVVGFAIFVLYKTYIVGISGELGETAAHWLSIPMEIVCHKSFYSYKKQISHDNNHYKKLPV